MRRRAFIAASGAAAVWSFGAKAQPQPLPRRPLIAALFGSVREVASSARDDFLDGMQERGLIRTRDFDFVDRYADGRLELLDPLAAELVRLGPDVVLTGSMAATFAVKRASATVPIVSASLTDPVTAGLAESHARPGGQVTGFLWNVQTLPGKQLELLLAAIPGATRIGMLISAGNPLLQKGVEVAAADLGIELIAADVRAPEDLAGAIRKLRNAGAQGLLVLGGAIFVSERARLIQLVAEARLPALYAWREIAEAGGFMSYGVNLRESFRHSSFHVSKILKGAKPGDLPLELPPRFDFVLNLRAARVIGLAVPDGLLVQVPEVIE
jgi:putative ABC transport system substrate-binding protein